MYGWINAAIKSLVLSTLSPEAWTEIANEAECETDFNRSVDYSEESTHRLLAVTSKHVNLTEEAVLDSLGAHFLHYVRANGYESTMRIQGTSFMEWLENLNEPHRLIRSRYPESNPPTFWCEEVPDKPHQRILHYYTIRDGKLANLTAGIIKEAALFYFGTVVSMKVVNQELIQEEGEKNKIHVMWLLEIVRECSSSDELSSFTLSEREKSAVGRIHVFNSPEDNSTSRSVSSNMCSPPPRLPTPGAGVEISANFGAMLDDHKRCPFSNNFSEKSNCPFSDKFSPPTQNKNNHNIMSESGDISSKKSPTEKDFNCVTNNVSLSAPLVRRLFPFHIAIDGKMRVIQVGDKLVKVLQNMEKTYLKELETPKPSHPVSCDDILNDAFLDDDATFSTSILNCSSSDPLPESSPVDIPLNKDRDPSSPSLLDPPNDSRPNIHHCTGNSVHTDHHLHIFSPLNKHINTLFKLCCTHVREFTWSNLLSLTNVDIELGLRNITVGNMPIILRGSLVIVDSHTGEEIPTSRLEMLRSRKSSFSSDGVSPPTEKPPDNVSLCETSSMVAEEYATQNYCALFLVSPDIKRLDDVEALHLNFSDFPRHTFQREVLLTREHLRKETDLGLKLHRLSAKLSEAKDGLLRSLRMKSVFVRYVSHEIRNPLNSALLSLKFLLEEMNRTSKVAPSASSPQNESNSNLLHSLSNVSSLLAESEKSDTLLHNACIQSLDSTGAEHSPSGTKYLPVIRSVKYFVNVAVDILNDLLLYERLDGGFFNLQCLNICVGDFVDDLDDVYGIHASSTDIAFSVTRDQLVNNVYVSLDTNKFSQVLRNLITNAIKFTLPPGKVTVSITLLAPEYIEDRDITFANPSTATNSMMCTSPSASSSTSSASATRSGMVSATQVGSLGWVRFSVKDTGVGISKADQARLFSEFSQLKHSEDRMQGIGLGLWISRTISELHGGRIGVYSTGELGEGSEFVVDLPIIQREVSSLTSSELVALLRNRCRVLMADDDRISLRVGAHFLQRQLFDEIDTAKDGIEALKYFIEAAEANNPYRVVFLDGNMPRMSGIEVARQIRNCDAHVVIIALTGSYMPSEIDSFKSAGFDWVLRKPLNFTITELLEIFRQWIDRLM